MKAILLLIAFPLQAQTPTLSVSEAVSSALAEHPRVQAAQASLEGSESRVRQASLNRLGSLETSYLWTPSQKGQLETFPNPISGEAPLNFEMSFSRRHTLTATLNQPLWTWGDLSQQVKAARLEYSGTREELSRTRQQIIFEATRNFLQALQASESVILAEHTLKQQEAFLEAARARVKAGSAAKLDELKAGLAVTQAATTLSETKNRERLAREALVNATADDRFREANLASWSGEDEALPSESSATASALAQRPDLNALRLQAKSLSVREAAARASGKPALNLRASVTQQNDAASDVFQKNSLQYSLGLALTWDGFGSLRSRARAAEFRAQSAVSSHNLRSMESSLVLEIRSALFTAKEAQDRFHLQERALTLAEEQARIARVAYREGILSAVEAQDAELSLTAAREALLRSRLDAGLARAALKLAMGE